MSGLHVATRGWWLSLGLVGLLWTLPVAAHAPPQATGIFVSDGDGAPAEWVRTNRGVILKNDDGEPPRLLCNDAYGASLSEVPPMIASPDGLILASYDGGLLRITPEGCDAQPLDAPLAERHVADLATASDPKHYLALLSPSQTQAGGVLISSDAGRTWSAAAHVPAFGTALLSAPSDAARVYISAVAETEDGAPSNQLLVSSDGAQSFSVHSFELADTEVRAFVVAVDPLDAERVFLRTLAGNPEMPERLLLSEDAGQTFSEVYSAVGPLVFAMDAQSAWLGGKEGLYRSDDAGRSFEAVPGAPGYVGCLRPSAAGLLVCGYRDNEFGVFRSDSQQGHFFPYLRFGDVNHQVACGDQVLGLCQANFDDWRSDLAPFTNGGASSDAHDAGDQADISDTAGASTAPATRAQRASGCNLRVPGDETALPFALLLISSCAVGRLRRRTPGRGKETPPRRCLRAV